jgi:AraC family transcriptional regulator
MQEAQWIAPDPSGKMRFVTRVSSEGRLWNGLFASVYDTSGGYAQSAPQPFHSIVMHVGPPVNARCSCEGVVQHRFASRGDVDILPSTMFARYEEDAPTTQLDIHVTRSLVQSAADAMGLNADLVTLAPRLQLRDPHIEHIGWALKAELESDQPYDRIYAEGLGFSLAIHLLRHHGRRTPEEPRYGLTRRQLGKVLAYINENLASNLPLAELARLIDVSPTYFKTMFKERVGSPVHKYIVRRRVEYALELIVGSKERLSDIALRAGFADQSHMSRCMRRVIGMSPTEAIHRSG